MRDDVTLVLVLEQMQRLAFAFGKPFGQPLKEQGAEYANAFRRVGLPMVAVRGAVDEAIALGKRFPSVSELIERARPLVPQTDGERQPAPDGCPQCGSAFFYAGYHFAGFEPRGLARETRPETVLPKLRCACPQTDPAWYTPDALAWEEPEPEKFTGSIRPRDYLTNRRYRDRPTWKPERAREFTRVV